MSAAPLFSPALHKQRHQFVIDFVQFKKPQKVLDLGCGECGLLKRIKFRPEVELLVGVDVNGTKLKKHMYGLAPLPASYLQPRPHQLRIDLYQGSVTQKDGRLRGFDLVTCIELVEHLRPPEVERFSEVVFGYMVPLAVIISTPNAEFNPLLPGLTGFRHSDHKFEWTREQFRSWALNICLRYGYEVEFTGVGRAPPGCGQNIGFCSQIGVFCKLGGGALLGGSRDDLRSHTLVYSVKYPSLQDNNILQRVLVNELLYGAERIHRERMETLFDGEDGEESLTDKLFRVPKTQQASEEAETPREEECEGAPGMKNQLPSPVCDSRGSVALDVLWFHCPKVRELSGSLHNLRLLIGADPRIALSPDGSALVLRRQKDQEEAEREDPEDGGNAEAGCRSAAAAREEDEDWEANN